jgi:hypothetical protein
MFNCLEFIINIIINIIISFIELPVTSLTVLLLVKYLVVKSVIGILSKKII